MTRAQTLNTARLFSSKNEVRSALSKVASAREMLSSVPGYPAEAALAREVVAHLTELVYRLDRTND